ncbi:hypothetical protein THAOC_34175 [Thalassiosira oceanica]|uniref:Uncharacterized protein n=1 Tax=Thalassiosira oceanica TaxID=159749 RepID=K0R3W6_THAOC|nr:hypothetical protein THAOC_34175 [Thalassiosira oceanica]|eukprot:EJK47130.1 hypothetical protein THAOC_34175 [Thalassiosira oceanica]
MKRRRCSLPILFLSATVASTSAARMRKAPDGPRRRHDEGVVGAAFAMGDHDEGVGAAMGDHDRRRRGLKKWNGIEVLEECKKFKNEELDECMIALLELETAEPTESTSTATPSTAPPTSGEPVNTEPPSSGAVNTEPPSSGAPTSSSPVSPSPVSPSPVSSAPTRAESPSSRAPTSSSPVSSRPVSSTPTKAPTLQSSTIQNEPTMATTTFSTQQASTTESTIDEARQTETVFVDLSSHDMTITINSVTAESKRTRNGELKSSATRLHEQAATRLHLRNVYRSKFATLDVESIDLLFVDRGDVSLSRRDIRRSVLSGKVALGVDSDELEHASYDVVPSPSLLESVTRRAFEDQESKEAFLRLFHGFYTDFDQSVAFDPDMYDVTVEKSREGFGVELDPASSRPLDDAINVVMSEPEPEPEPELLTGQGDTIPRAESAGGQSGGNKNDSTMVIALAAMSAIVVLAGGAVLIMIRRHKRTRNVPNQPDAKPHMSRPSSPSSSAGNKHHAYIEFNDEHQDDVILDEASLANPNKTYIMTSDDDDVESRPSGGSRSAAENRSVGAPTLSNPSMTNADRHFVSQVMHRVNSFDTDEFNRIAHEQDAGFVLGRNEAGEGQSPGSAGGGGRGGLPPGILTPSSLDLSMGNASDMLNNVLQFDAGPEGVPTTLRLNLDERSHGSFAGDIRDDLSDINRV